MIKTRWLNQRLARLMQVMPVVIICGPRQSGKTTLSRFFAPTRRYWSLDDSALLEQAQRAPETLILERPVTVDEVQLAPGLLRAVKMAVDNHRQPGDFLLTGSANLLISEKVSETLAGRAGYLDLPPFAPNEWLGQTNALGLIDRLFAPDFDPHEWPDEPGDWQGWLLRGGFPPALELANDEDRAIWFEGYTRTYLERDLRQLSAVSNLSDFQRLMGLAANQCSRVVNQAKLARDASLSAPTCHRYLNLLEVGGLLVRIPAWTGNNTTVFVKSPKWLWTDCGLAAWLAGVRSRVQLQTRADAGFWLEQAIFQTLNAWRSLDPAIRRIHFWRNRTGQEVDFILEKDGLLVGLEIKANPQVTPGDARGLEVFRGTLPPSRWFRGVVLNAATCRQLGKELLALPWGWIFPKTA